MVDAIESRLEVKFLIRRVKYFTRAPGQCFINDEGSLKLVLTLVQSAAVVRCLNQSGFQFLHSLQCHFLLF